MIVTIDPADGGDTSVKDREVATSNGVYNGDDALNGPPLEISTHPQHSCGCSPHFTVVSTLAVLLGRIGIRNAAPNNHGDSSRSRVVVGVTTMVTVVLSPTARLPTLHITMPPTPRHPVDALLNTTPPARVRQRNIRHSRRTIVRHNDRVGQRAIHGHRIASATFVTDRSADSHSSGTPFKLQSWLVPS